MSRVNKLVWSAVFLASGLILPFLTAQIQEIGSMLLPMHLPVLLCGFVLGWKYGLAVGFILPLMRSLIFGMPPMYPAALSMAFELAAYGAVTGVLYKKLPKKTVSIYISLIAAMLTGRIIWGAARWLMTAAGTEFSWALFIAGGFINAIPGIILQIVLIPAIVIVLRKARVME